jgi:hypothetical protein
MKNSLQALLGAEEPDDDEQPGGALDHDADDMRDEDQDETSEEDVFQYQLPSGEWVNVPAVYNGVRIKTEEQLKAAVDEMTAQGQVLETFGTAEEAEDATD